VARVCEQGTPLHGDRALPHASRHACNTLPLPQQVSVLSNDMSSMFCLSAMQSDLNSVSQSVTHTYILFYPCIFPNTFHPPPTIHPSIHSSIHPSIHHPSIHPTNQPTNHQPASQPTTNSATHSLTHSVSLPRYCYFWLINNLHSFNCSHACPKKCRPSG
jgi:hypothetical protein